MAHEPESIQFADGSDLARILEHVDTTPLRREKHGVVYRVARADALWPGYDPAKVRAAVRATAGSWADLNTNALIADLYRAREDGSRPADRPWLHAREPPARAILKRFTAPGPSSPWTQSENATSGGIGQ